MGIESRLGTTSAAGVMAGSARNRIGLGLAALGRPGYLNLGHGIDLGPERSVEALRRNAHAVLDAAYEEGVRAFDAARSYGRAEEFLGQWLRSRRPADVAVSSKWGYVYTANWQVDADPPEVKHHDLETLRRQLAETRRQLGSWLELYQIHSATPDSGVLDDDRVLSELAALQADGLAIGVTVSGTTQRATLERALELELFDAVQATWNLYERAAEPALAQASAAGLRVYVKEALANGRLAGRDPAAELEAAATEAGLTPDVVALAAVLARPWATVVLSGAATVQTLQSNLRASEFVWTDELERRLASLEQNSEAYWERRAALSWN
jgi:aryl-alcohol dehydrogenase-like predicted oxidoreductase